MSTLEAVAGHYAVHGTQVGKVGLANPDFAVITGVPPSKLNDLHEGSGESSSSESPSLETPLVKASDREKQRRNQYNYHIGEITTLLSDIINSRRKVDKTSILRLAADKLRNDHIFGDSIKCSHLETWSPAFMKFFDLFGGFMIGVTCKGRIFLVSPNIQEKLGYCHLDLLSQDIYSYVYSEDKDILKQHIYPPELQSGSDEKLFQQHHKFQIRIMRGGVQTDSPWYEHCRIDGMLRRSDHATAKAVQDEQPIRRQRVRQVKTFSSSGNDFVFIGMVHVILNPLPLRISPPTAYTEYATRHLTDGRIVQCDQSISLAVGYMIEEVTGISAFVFIHKEDVRWVICVLRQMYDQSKEFGESYYRLMSRSGNFIYMRTTGYLEIDKKTRKVQSFVCRNSVIGEEYGRKMLEEMKKKYSVIVNMDMQPQDKVIGVDDPPVEHPKRLERIVMHLVEPPVSEAVDEIKLVVPSRDTIITAIKNSEKVVHETGIRFDTRKRKNSDSGDSIDNLKRHNTVLDC